MIKKEDLYKAIADFVYMLQEYGCPDKAIRFSLKFYGFTDEQITEWYGVGE